MRLIIAALALSLVLSTTAAVFATWPVITDAPWEPNVEVPTPAAMDQGKLARCDAALTLRDDLRQLLLRVPPNSRVPVRTSDLLEDAKAEVEEFC